MRVDLCSFQNDHAPPLHQQLEDSVLLKDGLACGLSFVFDAIAKEAVQLMRNYRVSTPFQRLGAVVIP